MKSWHIHVSGTCTRQLSVCIPLPDLIFKESVLQHNHWTETKLKPVDNHLVIHRTFLHNTQLANSALSSCSFMQILNHPVFLSYKNTHWLGGTWIQTEQYGTGWHWIILDQTDRHQFRNGSRKESRRKWERGGEAIVRQGSAKERGKQEGGGEREVKERSGRERWN